MHAGTVERIVAVDHPQKARALLEGLGSKARHFLQRGAAAQRSLGVAKGDDIGGQQFANAGTRASSGAEAVLTSTPTALTQSSTTASSERDSLASETSC